jgi:pyruvate kinase
MTKLKPRGRKVKILATLGPASRDPDMLRRLLRAGADAFRVNMSHGEHEDHAEAIKAIRGLEKEFGRPITVLADLQGPKLRLGAFANGEARIAHGGRFTLDRDPAPGDETRVELPHPELFGLLGEGQRLLINDGKIRLRVDSASEHAIVTTAEIGGVVSDRRPGLVARKVPRAAAAAIGRPRAPLPHPRSRSPSPAGRSRPRRKASQRAAGASATRPAGYLAAAASPAAAPARA